MSEERFEIRKDGLVLKGKHFSSGETANPPVIISHEFGMNMLSTARYARPIAKAGYNVYIYDFCGSGAGISQGRKSTQMSVLTEKDDLFAVMDYVMERENAESVILGGCSQGGLVSALAAAERKSEVEKLFLIYPALCIPDDARSGSMLGAKVNPENPAETFTAIGYVKLGKRYVLDALKLDPWEQITPYREPVLIVHGTADGIVNISYARKAAELYENAKLVEIEGGKHIFPMISHVKKTCSEIIKFIK